MTRTRQGVVIQWDRKKGYGFIQSKQVSKHVFCHVSECDFDGHPKVGQQVTFVLTTNAEGRDRAEQVRRVGQSRFASVSWRVALVLIYAIALSVLIVTQRIGIWILMLVSVLSVVCYLVYWLDKRAAQLDQWRTRERSLHLLAVLGGWPGALFAQGRLRHKSRKLGFQVVFWISVMLNCLLITGLATTAGQRWLDHAWHIVEPLFS